MSDKRKPIEERIAALFGKTAYRDIRDGVGGSRNATLTDEDIAAQLGYIIREHGPTVAFALETYYGSTLMHERELRLAWEKHCRTIEARPDYDTVVLGRMGCALAVRQFAGIEYTTSSMAEYAWIICVRRQTLQTATLLAESWLDELWQTGLHMLREGLRAVPA